MCLVRMVRLFLDALAVEEGLEDVDNLLQGGEVLLELGIDLVLVIAELGVEVLAVRASAHGGTENGLDEEAVVGLESDIVGGTEGGGKLIGSDVDVVGETLAGELETSGGLRISIAVPSPWSRPPQFFFSYLTSQRRAWPALFCFSACSLLTRSWRVSDSVGLARKRWRIFCDQKEAHC